MERGIVSVVQCISFCNFVCTTVTFPAQLYYLFTISLFLALQYQYSTRIVGHRQTVI